jgi:hypothetical protein
LVLEIWKTARKLPNHIAKTAAAKIAAQAVKNANNLF